MYGQEINASNCRKVNWYFKGSVFVWSSCGVSWLLTALSPIPRFLFLGGGFGGQSGGNRSSPERAEVRRCGCTATDGSGPGLSAAGNRCRAGPKAPGVRGREQILRRGARNHSLHPICPQALPKAGLSLCWGHKCARDTWLQIIPARKDFLQGFSSSLRPQLAKRPHYKQLTPLSVGYSSKSPKCLTVLLVRYCALFIWWMMPFAVKILQEKYKCCIIPGTHQHATFYPDSQRSQETSQMNVYRGPSHLHHCPNFTPWEGVPRVNLGQFNDRATEKYHSRHLSTSGAAQVTDCLNESDQSLLVGADWFIDSEPGLLWNASFNPSVQNNRAARLLCVYIF